MPLALLGAIAGAALASHLPEAPLPFSFGVCLLVMGVKQVLEEIRLRISLPVKGGRIVYQRE